MPITKMFSDTIKVHNIIIMTQTFFIHLFSLSNSHKDTAKKALKSEADFHSGTFKDNKVKFQRPQSSQGNPVNTAAFNSHTWKTGSTLSLSILTAIFQVNLGQPVFIEAKDDGSGGDNWSTGTISRTKLQSNHHHQQTNIQFFYRPDALPVTQPTLITTKCICNFIIYGVAKLVVFVTGWLFVMSQ